MRAGCYFQRVTLPLPWWRPFVRRWLVLSGWLCPVRYRAVAHD